MRVLCISVFLLTSIFSGISGYETSPPSHDSTTGSLASSPLSTQQEAAAPHVPIDQPPKPSLKPAYRLDADLEMIPVGPSTFGGMDAVVLVKTTDLSTVAGYDGPKLSGKRLITGADWVRQDPDEKHLRLDARALVELDNGSKVVLKSVGVVELTPEVLKALSLTPGAKTGWDVVKTVVTFETPKDSMVLQDKVWIATARVYVPASSEGPPVLKIQYLISEVVGK